MAHEAYRIAFRTLMESDAPERRKVQLAEVVHMLSMASMRLKNIVWWEDSELHRAELEIERYEHFRMVTA